MAEVAQIDPVQNVMEGFTSELRATCQAEGMDSDPQAVRRALSIFLEGVEGFDFTIGDDETVPRMISSLGLALRRKGLYFDAAAMHAGFDHLSKNIPVDIPPVMVSLFQDTRAKLDVLMSQAQF